MTMIFKRKLIQIISIYTTRRDYSVRKSSAIMHKFLGRLQKRSKKQYFTPKATSMNTHARHMISAPTSRRVDVLNSVYAGHISDLAASGKYGMELTELGIQIIKISVSQNLQILFVYWISTKPIKDEGKVNEFLNKLAAHLKKELSALHIMGRIPDIRFALDKNASQVVELIKILDDPTLFQSENEDDEETLSEDTSFNENNADNIVDDPFDFNYVRNLLEQIDQNVYGLKRGKILENIKQAKNCITKNNNETTSLIPCRENPANELIVFNQKQLSKILFKNIYAIKKDRKTIKATLSDFQKLEDEEDLLVIDDEIYGPDEIEEYNEEETTDNIHLYLEKWYEIQRKKTILQEANPSKTECREDKSKT